MGWLETILDGVTARGFGQPGNTYTPSGDVGQSHLDRQTYGEPRGDRTLTWDPNTSYNTTTVVPQTQTPTPEPAPSRSYAPVNWGWNPVPDQPSSLESVFDSALDAPVTQSVTPAVAPRRYAGSAAVSRTRAPPMAQAIGNVLDDRTNRNSIF